MKQTENYIEYLRTGKHPETRAITSQGGIFLPILMAEEIYKSAAQRWALVGMVSRVFISGLKNKVPYWTSDISINWIEEGGNYQDALSGINGHIFKLNKYGSLVNVSEETILDELYDIEEFLIDSFGNGLGEALENIFINGDGINKPSGFLLNCAKLETTADNNGIKSLYKALSAKYLGNAAWLIRQNIFADLVGSLITQNDSNEPGAPDGWLMGKPCYVTLMTENNPVAFGDFSYYKVIEQLPVIQRLIENSAANGIIGFLLKSFMDARLLKPEAVIAMEI
jgi:HK97 family phage major capsid protein